MDQVLEASRRSRFDLYTVCMIDWLNLFAFSELGCSNSLITNIGNQQAIAIAIYVTIHETIALRVL